jgi:hypothetical protein
MSVKIMKLANCACTKVDRDAADKTNCQILNAYGIHGIGKPALFALKGGSNV